MFLFALFDGNELFVLFFGSFFGEGDGENAFFVSGFDGLFLDVTHIVAAGHRSGETFVTDVATFLILLIGLFLVLGGDGQITVIKIEAEIGFFESR